MKQGALIFDEQTDRYDIRFDLADYYGGLHCGECFDVLAGGRWKPTRIENGRRLVSCRDQGRQPFRPAGADLTGTTGKRLSLFFFPACPVWLPQRRDNDCRKK